MGLATIDSALGFGNGTIGKWGKSAPSADKLKMVADYFGVTVDYLLTGEEKESPQTEGLSETKLALLAAVKSMSDEDAAAWLRFLKR